MRKAAPKHRPRRKGSAISSSSSVSGTSDEYDDFADDDNYSYMMNENYENNNNDRRKKEHMNEADEKALVAKNYRLAKELVSKNVLEGSFYQDNFCFGRYLC